MKYVLFLLSCALLGSALAQPQATTSTKKKVVKKKVTKPGTRLPQTTWRNRQSAPTPERYKEIQQALATQGYLKQEPTGVWDAQSADALRQFQTEKTSSPPAKLIRNHS